MAKRKDVRRAEAARPVDRAIPGWLATGLDEAQALSKKKQFVEARATLLALDRRTPNHPAVLSDLANLYLDLGNMEGYQEALERLLKVDPDDEEAGAGLIGACLHNGRPVLALLAARSYVARWPDSGRAIDVRKTIAGIEEGLPELLAALGSAGDEGFDLAVRHEQIQSYLGRGRADEAREAAERVLRERPHFAPVLNNLCLAYEQMGYLEKAAGTAERVLETEPANVHALSNLARLSVLLGRDDAARAYAARLLASNARAADVWVKKAEGLTFAGHDAGVLEVAEQAGALSPAEASPMLAHLAAVAALDLGRVDEARRYWRQALQLDRDFDLARGNLNDLQHPAAERHGPWPFPLEAWLPSAWLDDLKEGLGPAQLNSEAKAIRAIRRFCRAHPEIDTVVPHLLRRGDPQGRQLALLLVRHGQRPALSAALRDFALSERGPDSLRHQAANEALKAGLIPSGPVRMWLLGEWREVLLMDFEITDEPERHGHSPEVFKLAQEAAQALRQRDPGRAEEALQAALAVEPGAADLLNNLSIAYQLQGRQREFEDLVGQIHAQHPDYLFARVSVARLSMDRGDTTRARDLLKPLLSRRKLHSSEFISVCAAFIELELAEDRPDAAQSWLEMWQRIDDGNPAIRQYRDKIARARGSRRLSRLFKR